MNRQSFAAGALAPVAALLILACQPAGIFAQVVAPLPGGRPVAPRKIEIDLDKATPLSIPRPAEVLKPKRFKTPDGKECWALRITGGMPIATPAYWGGMIFVGGGYGSHEFYAFNARTGELVWKVKTDDDGPSAAVVENGFVAFNTESCTVFVLEARTGRTVWKEWLGDPLMSQPALADGRLYMSYPVGQRQQHFHQSLMNTAQHLPQGKPPGSPMSHRLLCADLKSGRHLWEQPIPAEVISAPVVDKNRVYVTCHDGSSWCFSTTTGSVVWSKKAQATSAPVIAHGQVVITQKQSRNNKIYEGVKRLDPTRGQEKEARLLAAGEAAYLRSGGGGGVALKAEAVQALDASVGFSSPPASANLVASSGHLGIGSVVAGWAYQGARAAIRDGRIVNAQGAKINVTDAQFGDSVWEANLKSKHAVQDQQVFSPPALGKENMYLCSGSGHLLSVRQKDGKVQFLYGTEQPMAFQPALAEGNIYAGTSNGMVICVKTGSLDADGWTAWGGNAQHNKND